MRAFEFITEGRPPFSPTPEQQQDIADLYASGFSGADIAKEYKVSKGTISKFIGNLPNFKELRQQFYKAREEQGLSTGAKGITTDQIQQIANNFAFGKNFDQLSKEFGLTSNNIFRMLSKLSNYEELKQQNTKARKDQGLLSIEDLRNKGITSAQVDQMAKEYAKGETFKNVGKMFNINTANARAHLTKRPDWEEIKFQNRTNRSIKFGGTQSLTNRGINKPGSKGIHAIRRTGSPSGSVFEDEIMRSFEFITEVSAADLEQWNPERFQTQQEADPIGMISDKQSFSNRLPSCLDMPIKLPGTAIKNPYKNKGVVEFVQRSLQHNQKVNPRFDQSYIYLTVDQRMVEGSKTHRRGGAHFDGMQGERYKIKLPMDQNYIVSDYNPTHLYNQPFDARGLSTKHHNWFHELEKQVDKSRTFIPDPYVIYFVSGYHMHESPIAPETRMRTFMRISVGYKPGGLPGETPNPLLPTPRLNRDREIPANLKKDLKVAAAPDPAKNELEEDWKKTLGAIGVAGALAAGAQNTMQPTTPPEVRPAVASTVAPAENPDVNILAQTMWGEARSHGANGMLAVGNVIKNRAEANMKMFGQGIRGVALKPKQFSCWNAGDPNRDRIKEILEYDRLISLRQSPDGTPFDEWFAKFKNSGNYMDYKAWLLAKDIAKKIISDRAPDPTNGAVYYHTTDVNPSWNANLDHVATVGNHVFYTLSENLSEYKVDNVEGLGSVPYNQNVDYFGLRVMMKPSTFLSLALPLNEPRSVEYIMQHMKNGGALGAPFLYVKIPADWEEGDLMRPASISGHEGRNRMLAIQKLEGDDPVEVHLLLQGGMRARHLNPGMIKELQNGMMNQSRNRYVTGPLFSK